MTTHSLTLSPHEVRAALDDKLGLVVRPVKDLGDFGFTDVHFSSFHSIWGPDSWIFEKPLNKEETGCEALSRGLRCPLGVPGDRLICKETWADVNTDSGPAFTYRADNGLHFCQYDAFPVEYDRYPGMSFAMWCGDLWRGEPGHTWRRASNMPRWASRLTLEVVGVRCVRINSVSNQDILSAGMRSESCNICPHVGGSGCGQCMIPARPFIDAWNNRYVKRGLGWDKNPWAWAAKVKRVER